MKVAVIGSNGFIGRHLVERLQKETRLELFLFGKRDESLGKGLPYKKIDFFNKAELIKDFAEIEMVYYLASETIPATSWEDPASEIEKNLRPFLSFLEVVAKLKLKKIAFISSAGTVYGATTGKVPEDANKQPFSPYGIVKLTMENFLQYYKIKYGIQYDIFRVSNVYGEGQDTGKGLGAINTFLEKIIRENKVQIFGDGESTRNYIYVRDVIELLTWSVQHTDASDVYNMSSDSTLSLNQLVSVMKSIVKEEFTVIFEKGRLSDNSYVDFDNSKLIKHLPEFKFTPIEEGILKTYQFLKN